MNLYEHTIVARQDTSPAQIKQLSEKYSKIYSPYSAKIKSVLITKDQEVVVGQNLIELYSPELDKDINSIRRKILLTKTKINRMSGTSGNMDEYLTYNQRLIALQSELSGLTKTKEKLVIKAPNKGKVKDLVSLSNEMWVSNLDQLLGIVHYGTGNESLYDTAKVLSQYADIVMLRTHAHKNIVFGRNEPIVQLWHQRWHQALI